MIEDARGDGEMKMKKIDDEFGPVLDAEKEKLERTMQDLKELLEEEDEYASLAHALTTIWSQFPILSQAEEFWEKMATAAAHQDQNLSTHASPPSDRGVSAFTNGTSQQSRSASTASALSNNNNNNNLSPTKGNIAINSNFNSIMNSLPGNNNNNNTNNTKSSAAQSRSSSAVSPGTLNSTTTTLNSSPNRWSQIPKSFFTRLVEFLRSRETNQPSRYQLQQIIQTAERVLEGAWKDITSVEQPIKL